MFFDNTAAKVTIKKETAKHSLKKFITKNYPTISMGNILALKKYPTDLMGNVSLPENYPTLLMDNLNYWLEFCTL